MLKSSIWLAAIEVSLENEVVSDDIGNNASLGDETVKGEKIGVTGLTEKGGEDSVDGENGGTAVGVNGMTSVECGFVEIVFAD